MAANSQFDGLTVSVKKTDAGDSYVAFVTVNGVEFPLSSVKAGGFDQDLQEAQAAKDAADLQAARDAQAQGNPQ